MTFKAWGILLIISMLNFGAAFSVWAFANDAYSAIGWSYSIGVHDGVDRACPEVITADAFNKETEGVYQKSI